MSSKWMSNRCGTCAGVCCGSGSMASRRSIWTRAVSMCSTTPVMVKNRASGSAKRTSMTVTAASTGSARLSWVTQVTPAAMTSSMPASVTLEITMLGLMPRRWLWTCMLSSHSTVCCSWPACAPVARLARRTASPWVYSMMSPWQRVWASLSSRTARCSWGRRQRCRGMMAGKTSSMARPSRQSQYRVSRAATSGVTMALRMPPLIMMV